MRESVDHFLQRLEAVEQAWVQLDQLETAADIMGAAAALGAMPIAALGSTQLLIRAAALLDAWGYTAEARDLRAAGPDPAAPAAPRQLAEARRLKEAGDLAEARVVYRSTMLRARPDAGLLLEYAALEQQSGDGAGADAVVKAATAFRVWNDSDLIAAGRVLQALGRPDLTLRALVMAFRRGYREPAFLDELLALGGADEALLAAPFIESIPGGPTLPEAVAALAAHDRLAVAQDRGALVATAREREASTSYLSAKQLHAMMAAAIAEHRPLSLIRLGDGEGRFLLGCRPDLQKSLEPGDARVIARLIWSVWFGSDIGAAEARLGELMAAFEAAVHDADIIGLTSAARLTTDDTNFGYLAVVEQFYAGLAPKADRRVVDALCPAEVVRADPFLADLLGGLDFLGVIGPHPELAERLRTRLGIGRVVSYEIPGEGRLGRQREAEDRGRHFPEIYDRLMAEMTVPYPGAVFLVAGGLLGKIYCGRIRKLGGIALDIGAVADAWMGYETRGPLLADLLRLDSAH